MPRQKISPNELRTYFILTLFEALNKKYDNCPFAVLAVFVLPVPFWSFENSPPRNPPNRMALQRPEPLSRFQNLNLNSFFSRLFIITSVSKVDSLSLPKLLSSSLLKCWNLPLTGFSIAYFTMFSQSQFIGYRKWMTKKVTLALVFKRKKSYIFWVFSWRLLGCSTMFCSTILLI